MKKILTIIGARPQFIKSVLISRALEEESLSCCLKEITVNTGQHYDANMAGVFFSELNIKQPDYDLSLGGVSALSQISAMTKLLEEIFDKERPDLAIVYGDTNSTLAGAISAVKSKVRLAHVEAGLRSFDKSMPEEVNRILTDHITSIFFCPTKIAVENLKKENIINGVYFTGDIMFELVMKSLNIAREKSGIMRSLGLQPKEYFLATVHRESNTDTRKNIDSIISSFGDLNKKVIFPIHPRAKKMLQMFGLIKKLENMDNVKVIEPVGYLDMILLENNAAKILTDSGGVQKEAYFLKVPCVTLRENTEWVETLEGGWNVLTGADSEKIVQSAGLSREMPPQKNYYGDGDTSSRIAQILKKEIC
ncbi:UDP-n-acetylglucosamine 2-epimerase [Candidatus Omnitrophus magneticus]|uniref:UDP-n-acetylglucosamine 2-epimerase n=1 Tax=Candidatus Omnitrophus magneticus TaxID=1609969 RepID=A0A0F0CQV9_9BACT|nr:UDP-n-acetylglucosamine 2-epimerase [Candidatus Omnitrophus magneticus]